MHMKQFIPYKHHVPNDFIYLSEKIKINNKCCILKKYTKLSWGCF